MSNKQWYIFYVTTKYGMDRYLLEHYLMPDFDSRDPNQARKMWTSWQNEMRAFFRERTGIKGGQIVAIEPSEITSVYSFRKEDGYEG